MKEEEAAEAHWIGNHKVWGGGHYARTVALPLIGKGATSLSIVELFPG